MLIQLLVDFCFYWISKFGHGYLLGSCLKNALLCDSLLLSSEKCFHINDSLAGEVSCVVAHWYWYSGISEYLDQTRSRNTSRLFAVVQVGQISRPLFTRLLNPVLSPIQSCRVNGTCRYLLLFDIGSSILRRWDHHDIIIHVKLEVPSQLLFDYRSFWRELL